MKVITKLFVLAAACLGLNSQAQTFIGTHYDSIVSLATNVTKNYTFTDTNGLSVVVAVTMTPTASTTNAPAFTLLDFIDNFTVPTRLGVDGGLGGGDGNWVDINEGVNFSASLVSADAGIVTNSIRFGINGIGIRIDGTTLFYWSSSVTNGPFFVQAETNAIPETGTARLAGTNYSAHLNATSNFQLSDQPVPGSSIAFDVTFAEGSGSPVIIEEPADRATCAGSDVSFSAAAYGDSDPTVQWQVSTNGGETFTDIPGGTNTTLTFAAVLADNGGQYRATFTNDLGAVTTTVATLTVGEAPAVPVIDLSATMVSYNSTNTATGPAGMTTYFWSIDNGTILDGGSSQTVTYQAGHVGTVTLTLIVGNDLNCNAGASTNVEIEPLSTTLGPGVYVSDDSGLIERFDTNGVGSIFTFTPNSPSGLAFAPDGNLYVANWGDDNTIRKISTNGVNSVIASNVNWPGGIAIGGDGNLYTANWSYIQKITTNGVVSTFIDGINGADGLAFDRAGNLYLPDAVDNTIKKYALDGTVTTFTTNGLSGPEAVAFDSAGNLYVANGGNDTIWKYDADGNGTLFANTNLYGPYSLAFDMADNLYVLNYNDSSVTRFTPDGESTVFSSPDVMGAEYIAVWPLPAQMIPTNSPSTETIYGTTDAGVVEQFSLFGSESAFATGTGAQQYAAFDNTGNLYVVDQANHLIEKYASDGSGSVFTTNLNDPIGLAIDATGNVFATDADGIEKFDPAGDKTNFWSGGGNLQGLAFDHAGYLYLCDYDNNRILKFDANGGSSIFTTNVDQPTSIAFDRSGNLLVANYATATIGKFSSTGTDLGIFAAVDGQPTGLAFDSNGNLYAAIYGSIEKITSDGTVSLFAQTYANRLAIQPGLPAGAATTTPASPVLSSSAYTDGQFQFSVNGTVGASYVVEATTNLTSGVWTPIATNTAPFVLSESNLVSVPERFYRVVAP